MYAKMHKRQAMGYCFLLSVHNSAITLARMHIHICTYDRVCVLFAHCHRCMMHTNPILRLTTDVVTEGRYHYFIRHTNIYRGQLWRKYLKWCRFEQHYFDVWTEFKLHATTPYINSRKLTNNWSITTFKPLLLFHCPYLVVSWIIWCRMVWSCCLIHVLLTVVIIIIGDGVCGGLWLQRKVHMQMTFKKRKRKEMKRKRMELVSMDSSENRKIKKKLPTLLKRRKKPPAIKRKKGFRVINNKSSEKCYESYFSRAIRKRIQL